MQYSLLVTGPAYGTQQASSSLLFARALMLVNYRLSVFFYSDGVLNANQLTSPDSDEFDLVRAWQALHKQGVVLNVCVSAALRRGIVDEQETNYLGLPISNLQSGFQLVGLGALVETTLTSDRLIQF